MFRNIVRILGWLLLLLPFLSQTRTIAAAPTTVGGDDMSPVWSPDGKQIAFVSNRDGNNEIYVMNADGTNTRNLTQSPNEDSRIAWSPNSQQIAYTSASHGGNPDIFVINADGSDRKQLTSDQGRDDLPQWSPDGQWIAYIATPRGFSDIYMIKPDGSQSFNLSKAQGNDEFYDFQWSPDSQHVAFEGKDLATNHDRLFVTDVANLGTRNLMDQYWDAHPECCAIRWEWSPDSTQIAFAVPDDGNIYGADIATGHIHSLAYVDGSVNNVAWTPDGKHILYGIGQVLEYKNNPGATGVFSVNLVDGSIQQIAPQLYNDFEASPDRSRLMVIRPRQAYDGSSTDMSVFRLDDQSSETLKTRFYNFFGWDWSPDSKQLAASLCAEGNDDADIYLFNFEAHTETNLTESDAYVGNTPSRSDCNSYG